MAIKGAAPLVLQESVRGSYRWSRIVPGVTFASLLLAAPVHAQWEFLKVADGSTPIPGIQGETFKELNVPAISGERVAFYGRSGDFHNSDQVGIFVFENGSIRIVADIFTPIPSGNGTSFVRFDAPTISDAGQTSFWGQNPYSPLQEGIYLKGSAPLLRAVADVNTPIPGGTGTFVAHFAPRPSINSGNVAFLHWGTDQEGVYTEIGGVLGVVANLNTAIPGGQGTFSGNSAFDEVSISGSSVAFVGRGIGQEGIYSNLGGALSVGADLNTILPDGGPDEHGTALSLRGPSLDHEDLAFVAYGQLARSAIYKKRNGTLEVAVNNHTLIPGKPWYFDTFEPFISLDRSNIVFWGRAAPPNPYEGIFASYSGVLVKVIDNNDTLDGKAIAHVTFGPQALSGHRIAFLATFTDFSQGIYEAIAPLSFLDGFESGDLSVWSAHVPQ
jgi:hypothetical protein